MTCSNPSPCPPPDNPCPSRGGTSPRGNFKVRRSRPSMMASNESASALCAAAREGDGAEVSRLLQAGADVDRVDDNGRTPLHDACVNGHADVVSLLLDAGAEVDPADNQKWTPLYYACARGHADVVSLLLDAGADVDLSLIHI